MKIGPAVVARLHARPAGDDGGFTLVEVVVSLILTVVVMTGTAGFFVRGLSATRLMQQRQSAAAAAEQAMERVRAQPIETLVLSPPAPSTETIAKVNYTVTTTVTPCGRQASDGRCVPTLVGNAPMWRVKVKATWPESTGVKCAGPATVCEFTVSTLRNATDPVVSNLKEVKWVP